MYLFKTHTVYLLSCASLLLRQTSFEKQSSIWLSMLMRNYPEKETWLSFLIWAAHTYTHTHTYVISGWQVPNLNSRKSEHEYFMLTVIEVRHILWNVKLENGQMAEHDLQYVLKIIMKDSTRKEPIHYVTYDEIIFRYPD